MKISIEVARVEDVPKALSEVIMILADRAKSHADLINTTNKAKLRTEAEQATYHSVAEWIKEMNIVVKGETKEEHLG
jgi:hypothetical protein